MTKSPHKHRDIIIAWANGADIQYKPCKQWVDVDWSPSWDDLTEYRIKPEVIRYRVALFDVGPCVVMTEGKEILGMEHFKKFLTDWIEVEV